MTTTATNVVASSRRNDSYGIGLDGKKQKYQAGKICPECGCKMFSRLGKHGTFYGCARFPFCIGTIPERPTAKKPYDSYTQLLLDAHKLAIQRLSKGDMLGTARCVAWFAKRPMVRTDNESLLALVEDASAEASRFGAPYDFIQQAHDLRMLKVRALYRDRYPQRVLRQRPKPVFTRRWDNSLLDQIELDLVTTENGVFDENDEF